MRADLAASFQHTAIRHLEDRLRRAMDLCEQKEKNMHHYAPSLSRAPESEESGLNKKSQPIPALVAGSEQAVVSSTLVEAAVDDDRGKVQTKGWSLAVVGGVAANQELRRRLQV